MHPALRGALRALRREMHRYDEQSRKLWILRQCVPDRSSLLERVVRARVRRWGDQVWRRLRRDRVRPRELRIVRQHVRDRSVLLERNLRGMRSWSHELQRSVRESTDERFQLRKLRKRLPLYVLRVRDVRERNVHGQLLQRLRVVRYFDLQHQYFERSQQLRRVRCRVRRRPSL